MKIFIQQFDNIIAAVEAMILSLLTRLGAYFCAAVPGSFTALSIYNLLGKSDLALYLGLVVAVAWEAAGIVVTKQAIELWTRYEANKTGTGKLAVMAGLTVVYMAGIAVVVLATGEAFPAIIKAVGALSPVLAVSVYIANALRLDFQNVDARQDAQEADKTAWERERERLEMELKHAEKLARIEAKSVSRTVSKLSQDDTPNVSRLSQTEIMERILRHLETDGDTAMTHLAETLGISRSTLYRRIDELQDAGKLHKNGQGWEVRR